MTRQNGVQDLQGFRFVTLTYVLALALIATLSLGTHLVADSIIERQQDTARVVNISGRQRMLSQRIAELSLELSRVADGPARLELERRLAHAIGLMERSHAALLNGSAELGIGPTTSPAVLEIYHSEPHRLDLRVGAYLSLAKDFLALPPSGQADAPALAAILTAAHQPILDSLDAAVKQYERDSEAAIRNLRRLMMSMMAVMLATLAAEAALVFRPLFRRLSKAQDALLEAALTDPLTGCMNRRHLIESATRELALARRHHTQTAVLMLDIDKFKTINDSWGHAAGDDAIRTLVGRVLTSLRASDLFGRMGGEEFAVILPHTSLADAALVADKLRAAVAAAPVITDTAAFPMTVSIGATLAEPDDDGIFDALSRADQNLYRAKQMGRNRVVAGLDEREFA